MRTLVQNVPHTPNTELTEIGESSARRNIAKKHSLLIPPKLKTSRNQDLPPVKLAKTQSSRILPELRWKVERIKKSNMKVEITLGSLRVQITYIS